MLLTVDIGNTIIDVGIFKRDSLIKRWKLPTRKETTPFEYYSLIFPLLKDVSGEIKGGVLSSVVPSLTSVFQNIGREFLKIDFLIVNWKVKTGLKILYSKPNTLGSDRIANAVGAVAYYSLPSLVIDFGTAITMEVVNEEKEYLGGVILPGIGISLKALFERASLLPPVSITPPSEFIGKTTESSICSGVINGYVCLVEGMIKRFQEEIGKGLTVILTGGEAEWISTFLHLPHVFDPLLTLKGLKVIYDLNKGGRENE